jgi:hypothetical protein
MSTFLYWVPGPVDPSINLAEHNLGYAFGAQPQVMPLGRGPDGGPGRLVFDQAALEPYQPGFVPDLQTWRRRGGDDGHGVWVGYFNEAKPTAKKLQRKELVEGPAVKLGGEAWQVPQLRAFQGSAGFRVSLPRQFDLNDAGEFVLGAVRAEFAELDALAQRLLEGYVLASLPRSPEDPEEPAEQLSISEASLACAKLLRVNYRLDRWEMVMLGLLGTEGNWRLVIEAALDVAALYEDPLGNVPASAA